MGEEGRLLCFKTVFKVASLIVKKKKHFSGVTEATLAIVQ